MPSLGTIISECTRVMKYTQRFMWTMESDVIGSSLSPHERGITYQIVVNKLFSKMLSKNMEAYVDGMLVKSAKCEFHTTNLREPFECTRKHNVFLNPTKCVVDVKLGNFWASW